MLKTLLEPFRRYRRRRAARQRRIVFDPVYYLRRYGDLSHFSTAEAARDHYRKHGKEEGRFPNALLEEEATYQKYLTKSDSFDLVAYKALNPDVDAAFTTDKDVIVHYIRHGKEESRPTTFSEEHRDAVPTWIRRFSVSQFSAWASRWIVPPTSCADTIEKFERQGIERLAPLRFDHIFDPAFYREYYRVSHDCSDVELYKKWLEEGLPQGHAPSEYRLLLPYIGESTYPRYFDWSAYAQFRGLDKNTSRADVLIYVFKTENDWDEVLSYLPDIDPTILSFLVKYRLQYRRPKEADMILRFWSRHKKSWTPSLLVLRGDTYAALDDHVSARDSYEKAIDRHDRTLHAVSEAVSANIRLAAFDRAFGILRDQRDNWLHKAAFERLIAEFVERVFEHASARAHATLAVLGENDDESLVVAKTNTTMCQALELIAQAINELEIAPAYFGPTIDGHVALLGNEGLHQCTYYRIDQKVYHLNEAGIEVHRYAAHEVDDFIPELIGARIAIFYRLPATPPIIRAILTACRMGIPTYYDIDDLIFRSEHYPPPYATYQSAISLADYRGLAFGVPLFRFAMSLCDHAIASTPPLLEHMVPLVRKGNGLLIRNGLDTRNAAMIALGGRSRPVSERVRIFYGSGTLAHNSDFSDMVAPALARLMDEAPNVDLVLVGHVPQDACLMRHKNRTLRYPIISDVENYWAILSGCDINIAVLISDPATDCKSEIKWLEAAILCIPTIASTTATYRDIITDGHNGFLAETTEQWYQLFMRLSEDRDLRLRIGATARQKALDEYSQSRIASVWKKAIVDNPATCIRTDKTRVLVCNVFFSPQSIGGATRVVEDNVSVIAFDCPDIEQAVLCSDEGIGQSGRLRTSKFGDVPVFRLGIAAGQDMDMTPFDHGNLTAFRRVVEIFKPDIVHFHCIQRLTGSIVKECLERGIPYLVTLHDGWWISNYQFFVDEDGLLRLPSADILSSVSDAGATSALSRRRRLESLLCGAEHILAVSESFAELYRSAGVVPIRAIPNGVPDLPPPNQPDGYRGLLRLALIGGRSSHKGADLLEAALRCGHFRNLHLLVIDGWLAPGEKIVTRWGETSVTISAPFAQHDVASLYGIIDVLLAPSRWPESYGLVAREAMHFGLWVIASRIGAMSEDIIDGKNGFRIDTSDREDLDRILRQLDDDPDSYRQGTALRVPAKRSAKAQAMELAALYRSIGASSRV